jgi:catechol 2,3-dioxygenase-like lactoylglutathione lyase family enzyme
VLKSRYSGVKAKLSFDSVFYYVTDIEESIAFYRDGLGLPLVAQDHVARFDLDGVLIELVPKPLGSFIPGSGNARLCFAVSNLEETLEQLHGRGIGTSQIRDMKGGRIAFFHDPDGNELSIWQYERAEGAEELVHSAELPSRR